MLKELIGYCNSIEKTQAEMKVTLSVTFIYFQIKKNPQGTSSGEDEAKIQINDLEHKGEKKTFNQNSKKKKESSITRIG